MVRELKLIINEEEKKGMNNKIIYEILLDISKHTKLDIQLLKKRYSYDEDIKGKGKGECSHSCSYIKESNKKICGKVIEEKSQFCQVHNKLSKIYENVSNKNKNIDNFELFHIYDNLYKDIFNNVIKIDINDSTNSGVYVGVLLDNEIIFSSTSKIEEEEDEEIEIDNEIEDKLK